MDYRHQPQLVQKYFCTGYETEAVLRTLTSMLVPCQLLILIDNNTTSSLRSIVHHLNMLHLALGYAVYWHHSGSLDFYT